jgi:hypothetical protein
MSHVTGTPSSGMSRIVERQMRNWEISHEQKPPETKVAPPQVHPFLAVSRAVGLPADDVVHKLQERLHWPIFDKEILHAMAGDDRYRRQRYESLDEHDISWLEDFLVSIGAGPGPRQDYFHRLCGTISGIARKGRAIFCGRGADLILPRSEGLRVRLNSDRAYRVESLARAKGVSKQEAMREIDEIEAERAKFFRSHFHVAWDDPNRFDLIVNLQTFDIAQTVEMIHTAMRLRGMVE